MANLGLFSFGLVASALALTVVGACGGSQKAGPPGPADGSTTDSASPVGDAAIPAPGMATLSGPQSFAVASATMGVSLMGGCGGSAAADSGVIPTVSILLTSSGLPDLLCSDAGFPDGGTGYWLDIELATTQAAVGDTEVLTQSIVPGSYVVGDEGEDDPDFCMLPAGSNAFIQLVTPAQNDASGLAITGMVTIDSVSANRGHRDLLGAHGRPVRHDRRDAAADALRRLQRARMPVTRARRDSPWGAVTGT